MPVNIILFAVIYALTLLNLLVIHNFRISQSLNEIVDKLNEKEK